MAARRPPPTPTLRRLREARRKAGFTQERAAQAVGVHRQAVSAIEAGRRKLMASDMVAFCRLYRVTPNWMLGFCKRDVAAEREAFDFEGRAQ